MKKTLVLLMIFSAIRLWAQDAYHTGLISTLQTEFGLPATPTWALPNTETGTFNAVTNYGGTTSNLTVTGQLFTIGVQRVVNGGNNPWDAGTQFRNSAAITQGHHCQIVVWLRSPTPNARINLFAENATTYHKEAITELNLTSEWKRYLVPFKSSATYAPNALSIGAHLAFQNQTIEIGGIACLNYGTSVNLSQMPIELNNSLYDGADPNAPWRAEAAASIEQLRKANLNVEVFDASGQPIAGATVQVTMQQHEFKFGSAVVSNKFNGGNALNPTYEQKMLNLDGAGHGFNEVVFENDLKWPAWEQGWFSTKPELASDIAFLKQRGISMRGHNLVWPGWQYSPSDITQNTSLAQIKTRVRNHINNILTYQGVGTECVDWDVINEITTNEDYANKFAGTPGYPTGREIYREYFRQADSLAPNSVLYLNDFIAIENADNPNNLIPKWRSFIDEMVAANVPLEGIGFQGHFSASPTGIPRVKQVYDEFWNAYGLEAKVTEYDVNLLCPPATQASYMRDFLTITFAHPSMKGFLMWGFWDGAHWLGNAPIYNLDWTLKPSGEAFIDQVFTQWWTNESRSTTSDGKALVRGFKGKYIVSVTCPDGSIQTRDVVLDGDKSLVFNTFCTVSAFESEVNWQVRISPNPARDQVSISWDGSQLMGRMEVFLTDSTGRLIQTSATNANSNQIELRTADLPSGTYFLTLKCEGRTVASTLAVE
jgi:endo-1,4-beta-xylanase